jgi:hypothetical protein
MSEKLDPNKSTAAATNAAPASAAWWKSTVVRRWIVILVVASFIVDGAVLLVVRKSNVKSTIEPEYTLGAFALFPSDSATAAPTSFKIHVRFIEDLDAQARQQIVKHQYRVQENIEGLLEKARGIEWEDSTIARLKHQIQDRIDADLDLRAVAEVIFTDPVFNPRHIEPATPISAAALPTSIVQKQGDVQKPEAKSSDARFQSTSGSAAFDKGPATIEQ